MRQSIGCFGFESAIPLRILQVAELANAGHAGMQALDRRLRTMVNGTVRPTWPTSV